MLRTENFATGKHFTQQQHYRLIVACKKFQGIFRHHFPHLSWLEKTKNKQKKKHGKMSDNTCAVSSGVSSGVLWKVFRFLGLV